MEPTGAITEQPFRDTLAGTPWHSLADAVSGGVELPAVVGAEFVRHAQLPAVTEVLVVAHERKGTPLAEPHQRRVNTEERFRPAAAASKCDITELRGLWR